MTPETLIAAVEADAGATPRELPFGRPMIGEAERAAVAEVLAGPVLTHGPRVRAFEEAFAQYTRAPEAVALSTCTAALHLAYLQLDLAPGDEVIVPALTHVATAHAVELCGARCVFADADPRDGNVDPDAIAALITPRTKAIAVVHFLGLPARVEPVLDLARRHGLAVVEDCALALGATWRGTHVGLLGDAGCFSFYPVKHITTGEGGMLITRDAAMADAVRRQRAFGIDRNIVSDRPIPGDYDVVELGNNYRMSEMNAAVGCAQMRRLPEFLERRRENHAVLSAGLAEINGISLLEADDAERRGACYCHCIVLDDDLARHRTRIIMDLKQAGVGTSIYYPRPIPELAWYRSRYGASPACPTAARICRQSIALPVGPHLNVEDMASIVTMVRKAIGRARKP